MAKSSMPEGFWEAATPHLPPDEPVGPKGGRPRIANFVALRAVWYVLTAGVRWQDVPAELGCSGRTAHRRLRAWQEAGVWEALHAALLALLRRAGKLDLKTVVVDGTNAPSPGGGPVAGPNPTDRGKPGVKHTLLVDRHGVPLALRTAGANASDHRQILPITLAFPKVGGKPGRPQQLPDHLYADRGYDSDSTRALLRWLGIEPHIAKRWTAHGSGLGKVRWVVERTVAWVKGLRRMRVRWDRLPDVQAAWNALAMCVICFRLWCGYEI